MRRAAIMVAVIAAASAAFAGAPETSLRPLARPSELTPQSEPAQTQSAQTQPVQTQPSRASAETGSPAGRDRSDRATTPSPGAANQERGGLLSSLRPLLRPLVIGREAQKRKEARARGMVCGDPSIQGEDVGHVPGRISACGIDDAVRVRSIDGIALSQHALMDCRTASAVKTWIATGMKPAVGSYGGGVAQLRVSAHYACRTRNNQSGAKVSEHGRGRAIDISGFLLRDGRTITLLSDWGRGQKGQILSRMHRSACGPFGTVLGPESDRFHKDHFHFDTARYRSGSYCR
ncbi:extensin-like domain-containing protein [Roseovarius sp. D0-M9]|uniref:extensin-like domain-containing protein n=1 Tax=Roseovarius sp. D0-M9 TaxID=3127117 RepID=UPI00300FDB8F